MNITITNNTIDAEKEEPVIKGFFDRLPLWQKIVILGIAGLIFTGVIVFVIVFWKKKAKAGLVSDEVTAYKEDEKALKDEETHRDDTKKKDRKNTGSTVS